MYSYEYRIATQTVLASRTRIGRNGVGEAQFAQNVLGHVHLDHFAGAPLGRLHQVVELCRIELLRRTAQHRAVHFLCLILCFRSILVRVEPRAVLCCTERFIAFHPNYIECLTQAVRFDSIRSDASLMLRLRTVLVFSYIRPNAVSENCDSQSAPFSVLRAESR